MKKRKSVGNHLKYAKTTGIQTVSKHFKSTKYYNQNWDRSMKKCIRDEAIYAGCQTQLVMKIEN